MKLKIDVSLENYQQKKVIEDVKVIKLPVYPSDGGDFAEYLRINDDNITIGRGDTLIKFNNFQPRQISRSFLEPSITKAWHIHKKQNEIFFPTDGRFLIGLFDNREGSPTEGNVMRIYAGNDNPLAIYIPKGVAHGYKNIGKKRNLLTYVTDQQWDGTDEFRIDWDTSEIDFSWDILNG